LFALFEARLRAGLTRAGRNIAGAACLAVAAVFFSIAGWLTLVEMYGTIHAALAFGGIYLVLALLLFYVPVRPRVPVTPVPASAPVGSMIEAFLAGRAAGEAMRKE